jgi:formate dehydrogenase
VSWDEALDGAAAALRAARTSHGRQALGCMVGPSGGAVPRTATRAAALALRWDTPHLYGPLADRGGAAWALACAWVIGKPCALQSDVGRAHYVLLLGGNQSVEGWGPLQAGTHHGEALAHGRRTRHARIAVADPRGSGAAETGDVHLRVRPGTEAFLLLGMIDSILRNDWHDTQYVRDYCVDLDALREALAAWPVARCAAACGVPETDIAAVALKFSRAAMAVAHRSPQALCQKDGTLVAWATLVLHALTANLLRPGGLYEAQGAVDLAPVLARLDTSRAPRTAGGWPLTWLQAPAAAVAADVGSPDGLRALVVVQADPAGTLPQESRAALERLETIVALDTHASATTRRADWVLPVAHAWEEEGTRLHDGMTCSSAHAVRMPALAPPPGEARPASWVLAELARRVGAPRLGRGTHGPAARLAAGWIGTRDAEGAESQLLGFLARPGVAEALDADGVWRGGDVDRARWAPGHADGRLHLFPDPARRALAALTEPPAPADGVGRLFAAARPDSALHPADRPHAADPGVRLSPSWGISNGARVRIATSHGEVEARVTVDAGLHPEAVDVPNGYDTDVARLLGPADHDPWSGSPAWCGPRCRVTLLPP